MEIGLTLRHIVHIWQNWSRLLHVFMILKLFVDLSWPLSDLVIRVLEDLMQVVILETLVQRFFIDHLVVELVPLQVLRHLLVLFNGLCMLLGL